MVVAGAGALSVFSVGFSIDNNITISNGVFTDNIGGAETTLYGTAQGAAVYYTAILCCGALVVHAIGVCAACISFDTCCCSTLCCDMG